MAKLVQPVRTPPTKDLSIICESEKTSYKTTAVGEKRVSQSNGGGNDEDSNNNTYTMQ